MASQQDYERSARAHQDQMYQVVVDMIREAFSQVAAEQQRAPDLREDHETLLGQMLGRRWYLVGRCR
jgi:hypothetical protein